MKPGILRGVAEVDGMVDEVGGGFGDLLRRRRRAAGLTQEELAARAGLSARGIADLERGVRRAPRRDTVALLARALGGAPEDEAPLFAAARRVTAPPIDVGTDGEASRPAGAPRVQSPHNLPAQLTHLLGRGEAVRAVVTLVRRSGVRLVTLTGPGGIGKTRLAIQAAADLLGDFADGVWFVRLSRLSDPGLVIPTIAMTLGLNEVADQPIAETLRFHLGERRVLLALDNCEHVAAAAPDVAELLETCPALTVLATSRAPLRLRGEHTYPVAPLGLPPDAPSLEVVRAPERMTAYPAVALFVERAQATRPDFSLTPSNAQAIAEICARLDGVPLAIELAAARVKLLSPTAMLARLERGLGFLSGGARDLVERQQAMRSTIAWSENLLSAEERILFRRLSVFAGGCSLEAAQAVCATPVGDEPHDFDLLDRLGALVEQSLAQQRDEGVEPRFGMLRVIREYAQERLEESGEAEALRQAQASYMLALVERAEPELTSPDAGAWLDRLEREHDNLRAALGWARDRREVEMGLRLVAAVFRFWMVRGHLREGRMWVEKLLALGPEDTGAGPALGDAALGKARARALRAAGVLALYQGDTAAAETWLERATAQARAVGDQRTAALALNSLGVVAMSQDDWERAGALLEEGLALSRATGEKRDVASALTNLGIVVFFQQDLARAGVIFAEALDLGRQVGDRDLVATNLANMSSVTLQQGAVAQADALGREALALYRELGDPRRCAVGLEGLAGTAGMWGQGERAARLLGAAEAVRETLGTPRPPQEVAESELAVAAARAALGEQAWAAAFAAGRALSLEEAIAEALGESADGSATLP